MSGLTRQDWDMLAFIKAWFAARPAGSVGPGYEDIRVAMGWSSKSAIGEHLRRLQQAGYIRWRPAQHNSIELADGPIALVLPEGMAELVRRAALAEGMTTAAYITAILRLTHHDPATRSVPRVTSNPPQTDPAGSPLGSSLG